MRARELAVGRVPCLALRVTYVGELGWELYCPSEFGLALWDTLWEAGRAHGLVAGGYKAIDSLRLEKGYRVWGADITPEDTPFEAGLGFAVKLDKGDFVGREALASRAEPERLLRCLTLEDPRAVALGSEPVRVGDELVGRVTSGGYGYTVEKSHRVRVPPGRARRRHRGRGRDLRRVGRRRGRRRAAVRPAGRADPRVSDFAAAVERVWPGREARVEVLGGGITNHNLKVEVDGEAFVLRVAGKDTGLLGIDRRVELAATEAAAALGIGPEVVAFVEPEGWLVTRFVAGAIPPLERMREPQMLGARRRRAACVSRRRLRFPARFDSFRVVETYRRTALDRGGRVPDAFDWAHELATRIEPRRVGRQRGSVPQRPPERELPRRRRAPLHRRLGVRGHGRPLLRPRELLDQPRARRRRARALLAAYFGEVRQEDIEALELMRFMSDFREAMWGVVQSAVSELDFDFDALRGRALRATPPDGGVAVRSSQRSALNVEGRLAAPLARR